MKNRKLKVLITMVAVFALAFSFNMQIFADSVEIGNFEVENNDTYENANIIQINTSINGMISPANDQDHFIFGGTGSMYNLMFLRQSNDTARYVVMIYDRNDDVYVMPLTEVDSSGVLRYSFTSQNGHLYELVVGAYSESVRMYQFVLY